MPCYLCEGQLHTTQRDVDMYSIYAFIIAFDYEDNYVALQRVWRWLNYTPPFFFCACFSVGPTD